MADTHAPGLQHHFDSYEQQQEASFFGMWVFLATEVLFFGGLFCAYLVYRTANPDAFAAGSRELDVVLGGVNTAVLIGSSLTMAIAVHAAQLGKHKAIAVWMVLTGVLGGTFLGIKAVEYSHKIHEGLFPGASFVWDGPERNVEMFFNVYFMMTGLHALHMIIGIGILLFLIPLAWKGRFTPASHNYVEGFGLYWHFVDIVWIFLFPLLYLLGVT